MTTELKNAALDQAIKAIEQSAKARSAAGYWSRSNEQMTKSFIKAIEKLKDREPEPATN